MRTFIPATLVLLLIADLHSEYGFIHALYVLIISQIWHRKRDLFAIAMSQNRGHDSEPSDLEVEGCKGGNPHGEAFCSI